MRSCLIVWFPLVCLLDCRDYYELEIDFLSFFVPFKVLRFSVMH